MATYRDTGLKVRCARVIIDNPDKEEFPFAQTSIQFDRTVVVDQPVIGRTTKQVTSARMLYIPETSKEGYNGSNVFPIPADLIPGFTELTYDQAYAIVACLFEHASTIQDRADIAVEALRTARAEQGQPNTIV